MGGNTACPSGTRLYACESSHFRGCCAEDPCSLPNCPSDKLFERDDDDHPTVSPPARSSKKDDPKSETARPDPPRTEVFEPSTTEITTEPTKTKTDSGITHTIPNSSIVTVTKHTVVFSEAPSPSTTSVPESSSVSDIPTSTCSTCNVPSNTANPEQNSAGSGLTTGAIAGIATGGVVIFVLVVIIWMVSRRRMREKGKSEISDDGDAGADSRIDGYEKMSPHTTGTGSVDPFAPFGGKFLFLFLFSHMQIACQILTILSGRADQPHGPYPPQSGTFEMDSTPMAPVELPAISIAEAPDNSISSPCTIVSPETPVAGDPRSNLGPSSFTHGRAGFVNQWNQYKAMAEDKSAQSKN